MLHQKHSKLAKPAFGNFGRHEWAVMGTSCGAIQQLARGLAARLAPDVQVAYADAEHAKGDAVAETPVFSLEYTDKLGAPQFLFQQKLNSLQQHALFSEAGLVLVNGNHFCAARQIVALDRRKFDSLQRKTDRLTQVDLFLCNSRDEYFARPVDLPDTLKAHIPDWENIPVLELDDLPGLEVFLRARIRPAPLRGLILAGGRSTRMGEDKSVIEYHDRPQWQYLRDLLLQIGVGESHISCRADQAGGFAPAPVIPDTFLGLGPMGAILSAFREQPDSAWLVLACDLPLLDADSIRHLIGQRRPDMAATAYRQPDNQGFPEPLVAIWEPTSYQHLLQFLGQGISCPRKVLINSRTHLLDAPRPGALLNANTPDERMQALQALRQPTYR